MIVQSNQELMIDRIILCRLPRIPCLAFIYTGIYSEIKHNHLLGLSPHCQERLIQPFAPIDQNLPLLLVLRQRVQRLESNATAPHTICDGMQLRRVQTLFSRLLLRLRLRCSCGSEKYRNKRERREADVDGRSGTVPSRHIVVYRTEPTCLRNAQAPSDLTKTEPNPNRPRRR